jgi:hypothetical protein
MRSVRFMFLAPREKRSQRFHTPPGAAPSDDWISGGGTCMSRALGSTADGCRPAGAHVRNRAPDLARRDFLFRLMGRHRGGKPQQSVVTLIPRTRQAQPDGKMRRAALRCLAERRFRRGTWMHFVPVSPGTGGTCSRRAAPRPGAGQTSLATGLSPTSRPGAAGSFRRIPRASTTSVDRSPTNLYSNVAWTVTTTGQSATPSVSAVNGIDRSGSPGEGRVASSWMTGQNGSWYLTVALGYGQDQHQLTATAFLAWFSPCSTFPTTYDGTSPLISLATSIIRVR